MGALFEESEASQARSKASDQGSFTSVQQRILNALCDAGSSVDELLDATGLPAQVLMAEVTLLQIRGAVTRVAGNRLRRAKNESPEGDR